MAEQRLGRRDDERLAEVAVLLATERVEVVRRRRPAATRVKRHRVEASSDGDEPSAGGGRRLGRVRAPTATG